MPSRPPRTGQATKAPKQQIKRSGPKLTTTERGYGWYRQQLRLVVLAEEPLCRFCNERGLVVAAQEVDHIDGNSHNNDRDNLRPLCRDCHLKRTAKDQAFGMHQWRPMWLRPANIPLTIVCGPPASGKSTYVQQRAEASDLVIDLDVIASRLAGSSLHGWDRDKYLSPAIRLRNEMLGDISRPAPQWPRAWLIVSEPKAEHRQWWKDQMQPERIVVIETMPDECRRRVRNDPERSTDSTYEVIARWWQQYQRRVGDEVIRWEGGLKVPFLSFP